MIVDDSTDTVFASLLASTVHDAKSALSDVLARMDEPGWKRAAAAVGDETSGEIRNDLQRINHLLVELLTVYKMDHQLYALDIEPQSVEDLLQEALAPHAAVRRSRGISAEVVCPADAYAELDYNLVCGVLGNAVQNALRYARERIRLSAHWREQSEELELLVEDDGPGYPPELLATQTAPRSEHGFAGGHNTGLGLHFAQRVAQAHRNGERSGRIELVNGGSLGGACFRLWLP